MSSPGDALPGTLLAGRDHDPDQLIGGYTAARAQEALFDVRDVSGVATTQYDEFVDTAGDVRPGWSELAETLGERGRAGLEQLRTTIRRLVDNDGITYIAIDHTAGAATNGDGAVATRAWQLDGLPLLVSSQDWATLESGVVQRSRLLDAVLADLYGPRRAITSGVLPAQLLFGHPGYLRVARGIDIPGRHQLFLHGCDVSRDLAGDFLVNADWTQAPSGIGYALADRRVLVHALPGLYERIGPRPVTPFAQMLRLALIHAAPETAVDPVVVVLSPGIHSETAFDQAYLASLLGFPLVESADLVVRDGKLWMRSLGTLKRVDVVLRRVDAAYADPLDLRSDSYLGVAGLVEVQRRGALTVVNTLGSGILESPGVLRFLPELAQQLLGETPLLPAAPMYWGGFDAERSHLLTQLSSLLIKSTVGGPTVVGPALSSGQREELASRIRATPWQWVGQELPQFSTAPTDYHPGGLAAAGVGMRLFTVSQRGGYAPMFGGLGYVLTHGDDAYVLNTIAAKDVWVLPPVRAKVELAVSPPTLEQPAARPGGVRGISSPRVLSDLFWLGRYAERAEDTARLLIVTRERYHEYRHRPDDEGSRCVPVLLGALGRITGTDTGVANGDADTIAGAPQALWSLTFDRGCAGSLAQSVDRLNLAAQSVRDQMSKDTWMVLGGVERALAAPATGNGSPPDATGNTDDTTLASAQLMTLAGMLALSGVAAESMVRDVGWIMTDIGKRIERGLWLTALLRATMGIARSRGAEQTTIESVLVACESSVSYLRRNLGTVSITAVAELLLFDADNPRSLVYQLERLLAHLNALPDGAGQSRAERRVAEISTRLRRLDPADLDVVTDRGERAVLIELLDSVHTGLGELSGIITATQLALPGAMQPLWGPDRFRRLP